MADSVALRDLPTCFFGGTLCESRTSFLACEMESDSVLLVMNFYYLPIKIVICILSSHYTSKLDP